MPLRTKTSTLLVVFVLVLTLNILMLIDPLDAIKAWQAAR